MLSPEFFNSYFYSHFFGMLTHNLLSLLPSLSVNWAYRLAAFFLFFLSKYDSLTTFSTFLQPLSALLHLPITTQSSQIHKSHHFFNQAESSANNTTTIFWAPLEIFFFFFWCWHPLITKSPNRVQAPKTFWQDLIKTYALKYLTFLHSLVSPD